MAESDGLFGDNQSINDTDDISVIQQIKNKLPIILCVIIVIISGSSQGILIPLCTLYIPSAYFILLVSVIEINIIFTIIMIYYYFKIDNNIFKLELESILPAIFAGICCFLMCLTKVYASNPNRTSPIMQSTLGATTLMFSVIFSKLFLKKVISYNPTFVILSVIAITCSVLLPFIYELIIIGIHTGVLWTLCYEIGVSFRGLYIVAQEKYFIDLDGIHFDDKIKLLFYTNIIQIPLVIPSVGFEYIFENSTTVNTDLLGSVEILFTDYKIFFLFHGFILSYFIFLGSTIWLNTYSSNYVAVTAVIITPAVTIFFQIFSNLVEEITYPLYIIIPSLLLSVCGTLLWIFGEN